MRRRRYGGGMGGRRGSLDAGAMSAHISPGRVWDRLLDTVSPSPPFSSVVSTMKGGERDSGVRWDRLHIPADVHFRLGTYRTSIWFGVNKVYT